MTDETPSTKPVMPDAVADFENRIFEAVKDKKGRGLHIKAGEDLGRLLAVVAMAKNAQTKPVLDVPGAPEPQAKRAAYDYLKTVNMHGAVFFDAEILETIRHALTAAPQEPAIEGLREAKEHAEDMIKGHYPSHREYKVAQALLAAIATTAQPTAEAIEGLREAVEDWPVCIHPRLGLGPTHEDIAHWFGKHAETVRSLLELQLARQGGG